MSELIPWLLRRAATDDARVYAACQQYIRYADGVGDDDPRTNGEQWLLREILPRCRVAFDVGANRGDWTASAIAANPALVVHCFEPCRATFDDLSSRAFPANVHRAHMGLGAERRAATLFLVESAPFLNSLYRRRGLEDGWGIASRDSREIVQLVRLDEYCEQEGVAAIDYLKLDVEGHELDVLKGGARLFECGAVQFGQFEYGGCNIDSRVLLGDLFDWFAAAGYDLFKLFPDRLRAVPRYDQRLETFQYQNWVFARRGLALPRVERP